MRDLNVKKAQKLLSRIMEFELAGVVRYTHYSLMVAGPNRIPIVAFMKAQANESLLHAQQAGEILTGLNGHPTLQIAPIPETYKHSVKDILEESLAHERDALDLYREFLDEVEDRSVYLEEFARTQIAQEEMHGLEVRKMLRDVAATDHPEHRHDHEEPDEELDDEHDGDEDDRAEKKKKKKDKKKKD
jgi:bacterioferritin